MRELSDSLERITHIPREKSFILLNSSKRGRGRGGKKKAEGAEMLLKNITHLFFPTEMHSNALGDKCTAEVQRCETVCNITFSETFSRVDFQKFI